jgi:acetoacetyl-CoA synthetase
VTVPAPVDPAQPEVVWQPPADIRSSCRLGRYMAWLEPRYGLRFETYQELWRWSIRNLEPFWASIVEYFEIFEPPSDGKVLATSTMPGAEWYPGVRLNFAEHALRHADDDALVAVALSQTRPEIRLTRGELREQVARARQGLARLGVGRGDVVAAYLPNVPEALVAFLATASLGAIWSSCPPEFGSQSVLDRFGQIEPKVLLVVDGYRYGEKTIDRRDGVAEIRAGLPSVEHTVVLDYVGGLGATFAGALGWPQLLAETGPLDFEPTGFNDPLWVLFSSGTTGLPKAIVHGHGGIVLELVKSLSLHHELGAGDRFMFFTTTGWMMWNFSVATLLVGASFVMVDGDPAYPDLLSQWRIAAEAGVTHFGAGSAYLAQCAKSGRHPAQEFDLGALRNVVATGSPLPDDAFRWLSRELGPAVYFSSGSGGTDVCSAFVGGNQLEPTCVGEITGPALGVDVDAFDEQGQPVVGRPGELVVRSPMPSMPLRFWGDPAGERYRSTYFERYPGVWCHGDWIAFTERGSCTIVGRSDATLNRGGVRLGTGEFYAVVEAAPEVIDSLVVHLEDNVGGQGTLLLFVALAPGCTLDEGLHKRLRDDLRRKLSPRHSPDEILAVRVIPRTLTGKKLEIPIKRILGGSDPAAVVSTGALNDPTALDAFVALAPKYAAAAPEML